MTQSSLQTRCPNCDTRFRVTDEQLSIAKGKVRCGNCMEVFNAVDHQVGPSASAGSSHPSPAQPPSPSPESDEPASGFSADDDFVFADNPEEDAAEGRYAGSRMTFSEEELSDSFRSIDEESGSEFDDRDEDDSKDIDESWAEAMLADDDIGNDHSGLSATRESTPPNEPEPEPRPAIEPSVKPEAVIPPRDDEGTSDKVSAATDSPLGLEPTDDHVQPAPRNLPEEDETARDEPMTAYLPYSDLRREPVSVRGGSGGRVRTVIWSLVVLALIGVLVAQVTWFQFDRLSSIPELRPFYEQGCELAGCELKPLIDVDSIQSRKLVVRTDPDNRSQLLVEAVIINRATFAQPFPAIALTFSNLNGDVVAQSVFTPDEYIAGEGRELSAMPTDTPVRIAISIRDPGRDAVNYNIAFQAYSP
ncbi:DUF3426 domain-containing protein [Marinobacter sp. GN3S48]|uniref:DUF3426 domain-containing protein n=1 Tax=Marinobacter sp. GN3S48 TaxID=3382302 RepID=UPI00387AE64F